MQEEILTGNKRRAQVYHEPWGIVYLNGQYVPAEKATISICDLGFTKGDSVFDVTRTFQHQPFKLRAHIERLYRSLRYVRIDPGITPGEMEHITLDVLERNVHLLEKNDDFWLIQRVSRGLFPASFPAHLAHPPSPTVLVYCSPIPFEKFALLYKKGRKLVTVARRNMPSEVLDPRIKCQSRLHFILAMIEAQEKDPEAWPLMLDLAGNITETWGANIFFVSRGKMMTARAQTVLEGVTRGTVFELAHQLGLPITEGDFTPYDMYTADEAFVTATSAEILPVCSVDGISIGETIPGPITGRLMKALSEKVGVDIAEQALSHLNEEEMSKLNEGR